jgi:hypothetical protein
MQQSFRPVLYSPLVSRLLSSERENLGDGLLVEDISTGKLVCIEHSDYDVNSSSPVVGIWVDTADEILMKNMRDRFSSDIERFKNSHSQSNAFLLVFHRDGKDQSTISYSLFDTSNDCPMEIATTAGCLSTTAGTAFSTDSVDKILKMLERQQGDITELRRQLTRICECLDRRKRVTPLVRSSFLSSIALTEIQTESDQEESCRPVMRPPMRQSKVRSSLGFLRKSIDSYDSDDDEFTKRILAKYLPRN